MPASGTVCVYLGSRLQRVTWTVMRTPSVRVYALPVGAKPHHYK